jgi:hypothetical protein
MNFLVPLSGVTIQVSDHLLEYRSEQFRRPKSRKRRIRRKWAKDPRNWRDVHVPRVLSLRGVIVCDPVTFEQMKTKVKPKHIALLSFESGQ